MAGDGSKTHSGPDSQEVHAIAACQKGDREAYGLIVKRYAARAHGVARSILRDGALAEDVAQEAFVRAYRAIKRFNLSEPFYPWFYRILKNCCLTALKKRRRTELSVDLREAPPVVAPANDPADAAGRKELKAAVRAGMDLLSAPHREILHLSHFEGLAYKEIAACLEIPIGTVMSRLWAARQALRRVLEPVLESHE